MPSRPVITSSDEDGDGAGPAWVVAKDSKEATDSRRAEALSIITLLLF